MLARLIAAVLIISVAACNQTPTPKVIPHTKDRIPPKPGTDPKK